MPRKRTIDDLREVLFNAVERLENCSASDMEVEVARARLIGDLGKVVIDSARVEVQRERIANQPSGSGFFSAVPREELTEGSPTPRLVRKGADR